MRTTASSVVSPYLRDDLLLSRVIALFPTCPRTRSKQYLRIPETFKQKVESLRAFARKLWSLKVHGHQNPKKYNGPPKTLKVDRRPQSSVCVVNRALCLLTAFVIPVAYHMASTMLKWCLWHLLFPILVLFLWLVLVVFAFNTLQDLWLPSVPHIEFADRLHVDREVLSSCIMHV